MNKSRILILSLFAFVLLQLKAENELIFQHFSRADGLSNNSVRSIYQDEQGFLWFGTLNGINKYDGVRIKNYHQRRYFPKALNITRVTNFYEDGKKNLWLLTYDGTAYQYNAKEDYFYCLSNSLTAEQNKGLVFKSIHASSEKELYFISTTKGCIRLQLKDDYSIGNLEALNLKNRLPDNRINIIYTDKDSVTWLGTGAGLVRIKGNEIKVVSNPHGAELRNQDLSIRSFYDMDSVILWGTDRNGIYAFNRKTSQFYYKKEYSKTVNNTVFQIGSTNGKDLFIASYGNGFFYYPDRNGKGIQYFTGDKGLNDPNIHDVYTDRKGYVWFMTKQRGITQFDPFQNKFQYFSLEAEKRQSIGDPEKLLLFEDSNDDLWIGIYGGGLSRYDREKNTFDQYTHNNEDPHGLSSDYILSIYEDDSKTLWIGTMGGGLNKISLRKNAFTRAIPNPNSTKKIDNEVRSILRDNHNHIWLGTKGGKVFCYDQHKNLLGTIPDDLADKTNFSKASVYTLMNDIYGNLWIGTKGEGIYVIKNAINQIGKSPRLSGEVVHFVQDDTKNSLSHNDIYDLLEIDGQTIWIATHNGGLNVLTNPMTEPEFTSYVHNDTIPTSISNNMLRCFLRDNGGNIWVGTSNGLNYLDRKYIFEENKKFEVIQVDPVLPTSIRHNDILSITQIAGGNICIGTFGGGISILQNQNAKNAARLWKTYSENDGLNSSIIYSIVEDRKNNLWLSSDYGVSTLNPITGDVENFLPYELEERNAFSENVGLMCKNGEIMFGQPEGCTSFFPDSIDNDTSSFPIYITELLINNEPVFPGEKKESILHTSINITKNITLKYNQNFITFEYALLNYANSEKIEYSYILENFEKNWNDVGNTHSANYKGLPPGEYVFKVKGSSNGSNTNVANTQLKVHVLPPWWKTKMAILAYILFVILVILTLRAYTIRQIQLQQQIKHEKENTDNKLRFYTNISHELKTPLSLIMGPAEDLISTRGLSDLAKSKALEIIRNTKRLLELIDQLVDFRKIQKGHIDLKVNKVKVMEFFRNIYLSFLPLAEKKGINFVFEDINVPEEGYLDVDKMQKISLNLLSNAFKHTPNDKTIRLKLQYENDLLHVSVIDQGKGINENELPHIFERFTLFTKSDRVTDGSSGIGLSLTKELVNIHKGKIEVTSDTKSGSNFSVIIPIDQNAYSPEEISNADFVSVPILDYTKDLLETEQLSLEEAEASKGSAGPNAPKILIIEDNDDLKKYLDLSFKPFYNILTAENGVAGLEMARKEFPDLIICDVMMPEMDGIEVTRSLKQEFNTSHIPIILLTAKSSDEFKEIGLQAGADAYVTKPFSMRLLKIRVKNMIEQRTKLLQKFGENMEVTPVDLGGTNKDQAFLTKVISLIEENMGDTEFNVNTIVDEFAYGRTVFYKKIKSISGYAPNDFIRIIRMKKAASALKNTDLSIAEISMMVGFNDANYFSRIFKKQFGKTPSEYRRAL